MVPNKLFIALSFKASLQKVDIPPYAIKTHIKDISHLALIITAVFPKALCNALCTTARIKNSTTLPCFTCKGGRDDSYHYFRCPYDSFIFWLPAASGNIFVIFVSKNSASKLAVFFEVYYIFTTNLGLV